MNKKTVLPNGLRVVSREMKDRDSVALGLWAGVGGRYETDAIKGAAHFFEHIVFKGSRKYGCEKIKESIEGVGGSLNAFTSEEQTCYYAKIPARHLSTTFDVLADMVFFPKIRPQDMAKEKTVILEEIKMYHDLPQYYVLELLGELLWPDHPLGKNLAGTAQSVMGLTRKNLTDFHATHYCPENIVVSACGRLQHNKIVQLVKKKLGAISSGHTRDFVPAIRNLKGAACKLYKKDIEQMHLALGTWGFDETDEDKYAMSLLSTILGGNMSSRLFVEIREKRGLAYSISCSAKSLHDTGLFLIRAGVDNRKVEQAVDLIFKTLESLKKRGVRSGEFKRGKEYLLGQLLLGLEDTMEHMLWLGESVIARNEIKTRQDVVKKVEAITPQDIRRVARRLFDQDAFRLAVVGPLTRKQESHLKSRMRKG